jgi:hypothetical protein
MGVSVMKKAFLSLASLLIAAVALSSFASARGSNSADVQQRQAALKAVGAVSKIFRGLTLNTFRNKNGYWEARKSFGGQNVTIVLYKQPNKRSYNVAFTSPQIRVGALLALANKSAFGKFSLKHATVIIVSPNSLLESKQGTTSSANTTNSVNTSLSSLPAPIASSLRSALPAMRSVLLPTGIFTFGQMQAGNNKNVTAALKFAGAGNPIISSASINAGNYQKLAQGQADLFWSLYLKRKNVISRLIAQTQILETPTDAQPVLTLSGSTAGGELGVKYQSKFLFAIPGSRPKKIIGSAALKFEKTAVSMELIAGLGNLVNPVIVPKVISLKDVKMDDVKLFFKLDSGKAAVPELSVALTTSKMEVKKRKTYGSKSTPARFQFSMTAGGVPTGALLHVKANDTVDLVAIADLAEVAFRAHPSSKKVPAWAKKNVADKLQLKKLPPINIHNAEIYFATPGQDKSHHIADIEILKSIGGAGVRVKGELRTFGKSLATADLGLDTSHGLKSKADVKPFSVGPLALKNASFDLKAGPDGKPHFKIHGKGKLKGVTISETALNFSRSGFEWTQDFGCLPPMLKATIKTEGFYPKKIGLKGSNCAAEVAKAALEAGKAAAGQVAKTSGKAVKAGEKAGKDAGKWVAGAAGAAKKFAKKTGCKVKRFFGGSCNNKKRERQRKAKRKAALAKAAHYRKKVATPGHCGWGWYWNHKYRTCWRSPDSKMLVYTLKGAAKGLCVNSWGNPRVAGSVLALWDCLAGGRQQFTQEMVGKGPYFLLKNAYGVCFRAKSGKSGAAVVTAKCKNQASQRWKLEHGRLVGRNNRCLRSRKLNTKQSHLFLQDCNVGIKVSKTAKPPIEWAFVTPANNAAKHYHKKFGVRTNSKLRVGGWCLESPALLPEERIRLRKCNNDKSSQLIAIGNVRSHYFALVPQNSKMCLDVFAYKKHDFARVVTWPCNFAGNQQWVAVIGNDKVTTAKTFKHKTGFMIKSRFSGKCLAPHVKHKGKNRVLAWQGARLVQVKCNPRDTNMRFKSASR